MALSLHAKVGYSLSRVASRRSRWAWVVSHRRIETDVAQEDKVFETKYEDSNVVRKQSCPNVKSFGRQILVWSFFTIVAVITADEATSTILISLESVKISCGNYAGLSDGCAVAEYGGSAVMATAVGKGDPAPYDIPLLVHYVQKAAAIGRIPTNFVRRDLGFSDYEILTSRIIDRSLRPLFQLGHAIETQIFCNPLALDGENFPEPLAINAASAALAISDIPWNGPVAAARVALINNEVVINPTKLELASSQIDLIVTTRQDSLIIMLGGSFNNVLLNDIIMCIKAAVKSSKATLASIMELRNKFGKTKRQIKPFDIPQDIIERMHAGTEKAVHTVLTDYELDKLSRDRILKEVYKSSVSKLKDEFPDATPEIFEVAWLKNMKEMYRTIVNSTGKRCDGRGLNDVRPINCDIGLYKSLHGSAIFKRGQTQVFSTVALDSPNSALRMDKISMLITGVKEKNFFHHYEFPPYATGEIGIQRRSNRREIGHGNLVEKALNSTIPESFPFTIRLTSEVLESNGSSSMASVCGGTLALLDAGVPIQYPVAGVAMGLLTNGDVSDVESDGKILTDILGFEDFLGDMDFKVAGTKTGYTALQLDMKVPGLPLNFVSNALAQAKKGLIQVLRPMKERLNNLRTDSKDNWPVIEEIEIPQYLRSKLVGHGGAKLKKFELDVGVEILNFEGDVMTIFATNKTAMKEAKDRLEQFLAEHKAIDLEFGGIYTATVVEIKNHGCFVTLHPSVPRAFISLSQLDHRKVSHPSALGFEVGSQFKVKYFGRDPVSGILRLSRKILLGRDESS